MREGSWLCRISDSILMLVLIWLMFFIEVAAYSSEELSLNFVSFSSLLLFIENCFILYEPFGISSTSIICAASARSSASFLWYES